jgi:uncharacterized membrane protein YgcG
MKRLPLVLLIIFTLSIVLVLSACVADKSRTQFCHDYEGIFTDAQVAEIDAVCRDATSRYGVTFLVATCHRNVAATNIKAELIGTDVLRRLGLSQEDDYVIVIINAQAVGKDYHFDIYRYGRAVSRLPERELEKIGFSESGDLILTSDSAQAVRGLRDMMPALGKAYDGIPLWANIVIGLAVGLLVAGLIAWRIARGYSRRRKNVTYPLDKYCQMQLKDHEDKFMRSTTTVVVINNNSGSGSSHGGGSHFSGGGGGAGHGFGR